MRFSISANSTFDKCSRKFDLKSGTLRVNLTDDSVLIFDHHGEGKATAAGEIHVSVRTAISTFVNPDVRSARGSITLESLDGNAKLEVAVEFGHRYNDIVITGETS